MGFALGHACMFTRVLKCHVCSLRFRPPLKPRTGDPSGDSAWTTYMTVNLNLHFVNVTCHGNMTTCYILFLCTCVMPHAVGLVFMEVLNMKNSQHILEIDEEQDRFDQTFKVQEHTILHLLLVPWTSNAHLSTSTVVF